MLGRVRRVLVAALSVSLAACGARDWARTLPTVAASPGERVDATVTRVVDGDTIHVALDGGDVTIRLIGIDTPETVDPQRPVACYGPEASHFTTTQLTGSRIQLELDRDPIDPFGRTLAYVWLDGRLFNETLVEQGYAEARAYPPNTKYQGELDAAEDAARAAGSGLWTAC